MIDPSRVLAADLQLPLPGVAAALALFEDGATLPFIARYRKERTGGLDEVQLRAIDEGRTRLAELCKRRAAILKALTESGKLTPSLRAAIEGASTRAHLEDLYAPHKSKRRTRADAAREAGYDPLAQKILAQPRDGDPQRDARRFGEVAAALAGARDIVAEQLAADPTLRASVRRATADHGRLKVSKPRGKSPQDLDPKFSNFIGSEERLGRVPPHRYLALCRGEAEGQLSLKLRSDEERTLERILRQLRYFPRSPYGPQLREAAEDALKRLLFPAAERAIRSDLKSWADDAAIRVFGENLDALLMAAPLGARPVLGIDPGLRTGCKVAVVDASGALIDHATLQLIVGNGTDQAAQALVALVKRHHPAAVAVGNGTGGRDALAIARAAIARWAAAGSPTAAQRDTNDNGGVKGNGNNSKDGADVAVVVSVNEAGASVYSASPLAGQELPQVDVTIRGAVSIARRLQDPLAELVKIPARSIGVGQYQHDVDQARLDRALSRVVEGCVSRVGVDLNTASPTLLEHVAGVGPKLARAITAERSRRRGFRARSDLKAVTGLGAKAFEQCAGFLRVRGGAEPLDSSAVHPESYGIVRKMARDAGLEVAALVGNADAIAQLNLGRYVSDDAGEATLRDIIDELKKPGRDPRQTFEAPRFDAAITGIDDLHEGMILEGVITNVTDFGAFVDVGVKQDGLVHISQLADRFVRRPADVVSAGQRVKVRIMSVDAKRQRIGLSMKGT